MTKISKFLIGAALSALVLPTAALADVTGTSSGTFSFPAGNNGCDHSGTSKNCDIINSDSELEWGSNRSYQNFYQASTLTANGLNIDLTTASNPVKIAELTWYNSSTNSDYTPDLFTVDYLLKITFGSSITDTFDLSIDNTANPMGDRIGAFSLPDLTALNTALSTLLPAWSISGLQYVTDNGSSVLNSNCGNSGTKSTWCNPEDNTAHLFIEANFAAKATSVPEPLSLSLFGAGLMGAVVIRRRTNKV